MGGGRLEQRRPSEATAATKNALIFWGRFNNKAHTYDDDAYLRCGPRNMPKDCCYTHTREFVSRAEGKERGVNVQEKCPWKIHLKVYK